MAEAMKRLKEALEDFGTANDLELISFARQWKN